MSVTRRPHVMRGWWCQWPGSVWPRPGAAGALKAWSRWRAPGAHRAVTTLHSRLLSPHSHRSRSLALAILVIEWPSPRQYLALTGGNRYISCNELQWECWMVLPCTSELWSVLSRLALCLWSSYKWVIPPVFLVSLSVSQCHLAFCPDLCSV